MLDNNYFGNVATRLCVVTGQFPMAIAYQFDVYILGVDANRTNGNGKQLKSYTTTTHVLIEK